MDTRESICLLCPLGCAVAFRAEGAAVVGPEFVAPRPGAARVCPRGLYGTSLLNHPQRVAVPLVRRDGALREASWDVTVAELSARLREIIASSGPGSVAVLADPMRGDEELQSVGRLARCIGTDAVSVLFEPQDEALAAEGSGAGAGSIDEAGCVIVLGDVFFSHPVLARQIIDAKYTARGNSLFVVDPRRSNTAWFASEYVQNRPGSEALVLAAVLKALAKAGKAEPGKLSWLDAFDEKALLEGSGVSAAAVGRMARSFADASKGAVVVAPSARGMSDAGLVARLARLTAESAGAGKSFVGLPSEGNARGAYRAAVNAGWKPASGLLADLVAGKFRALVTIGADPLSTFPSVALHRAVHGLSLVASYSLFRNRIEDAAGFVLAGATWLESDGSSVMFDGSPIAWKGVGRPSWGVRALPDVVSMLERAMNRSGDAPAAKQAAAPAEGWSDSALRERLERVVASPARQADEKTLIALPASGHTGAGGVTRWMDWAGELFPAGVAEIAVADAAIAGILDGDAVTLVSDVARAQFKARVTDRLRAGVVAVAAHDPDARALFSWSSEGKGFSTAPGSVRIAGEAKR